MGSCVYLVKNVRDPTITEAYAYLQGVVFANEMGFGEVLVEGDSMTKNWRKKMTHAHYLRNTSSLAKSLGTYFQALGNCNTEAPPTGSNGLVTD
ncbi:hypothetical protein Golax_015038, partial [Gossypium laxum]|nr:hypothetical protein [Gossypium laxum]